MKYTLSQELLIHNLIKEKIRSLHDQLNDRKVQLTETQFSRVDLSESIESANRFEVRGQ